MKQWLRQWKPKDVIALTILVGAFTLRALGYDSFMESLITAVAVGYGLWTARDLAVKS